MHFFVHKENEPSIFVREKGDIQITFVRGIKFVEMVKIMFQSSAKNVSIVKTHVRLK